MVGGMAQAGLAPQDGPAAASTDSPRPPRGLDLLSGLDEREDDPPEGEGERHREERERRDRPLRLDDLEP